MITKDLELKVIDLGFAKHLAGNDGTGLLKTRLGTAMYMAPEIEKGKAYKGEDVDVFAFGTMLFVAKVVKYPWDHARTSDNGYKAISGNFIRNAAFWHQYRHKVTSAEFKDLVNSAVKKDPAARASLAQVLNHPWMKGEMPTRQ